MMTCCLDLCKGICSISKQTKRDEPSNVVDYEKIDEDARVSEISAPCLFHFAPCSANMLLTNTNIINLRQLNMSTLTLCNYVRYTLECNN